MCQRSLSCSRCSLQSFFAACFQPRVSGCFHPLQMFQKARIWHCVAAVEERLISVRRPSKCPLCRRETLNQLHLNMCQHSCCQHFGRFQIRPLQRDSRRRVFHNSNGVFCNRRLDGDQEQFACRSTFRALPCCARLLQDLFAVYASVQRLISIVLQQFHHTTAINVSNLLTFGPDVSNCEFCGFISTHVHRCTLRVSNTV